jgi:hypothetical protein
LLAGGHTARQLPVLVADQGVGKQGGHTSYRGNNIWLKVFTKLCEINNEMTMKVPALMAAKLSTSKLTLKVQKRGVASNSRGSS